MVRTRSSARLRGVEEDNGSCEGFKWRWLRLAKLVMGTSGFQDETFPYSWALYTYILYTYTYILYTYI